VKTPLFLLTRQRSIRKTHTMRIFEINKQRECVITRKQNEKNYFKVDKTFVEKNIFKG